MLLGNGYFATDKSAFERCKGVNEKKVKTLHPDCITSESKYSHKYNHLCCESFKLFDSDKEDKIITKILKNVL